MADSADSLSAGETDQHAAQAEVDKAADRAEIALLGPRSLRAAQPADSLSAVAAPTPVIPSEELETVGLLSGMRDSLGGENEVELAPAG